MDRFRSFRVHYQRVIALPKPLHQLMDLQFDFHSFVEFLNHVVLASLLLRTGSGDSILTKRASIKRAILPIRFDSSLPDCGALPKEESVMADLAQVATEWTEQQQRQDHKFDRFAAP
jgi:hypothetical protein